MLYLCILLSYIILFMDNFEGLAEDRGIMLKRIFNPLQGDFQEGYYELDVIEHGNVTFHYGNGSCRLRPASFFLGVSEPSLVIRSADVKEGLSVLQMRFHRHLFPSSLLALPEMRKIRAVLKYAEDGIYGNNADMCKELCDVLDAQMSGGGITAVMSMYQALSLIGEYRAVRAFPSRKLDNMVLNIPQDVVIRKLNDYMSTHVNQAVRLADMAKVAGLTETSLCRFYKSKMGVSPIAYMDNLRLKRACELLEYTDRTVKEIVYECGYSDTNFFYKLFKRKIGMTPLGFRVRKQKLRGAMQ